MEGVPPFTWLHLSVSSADGGKRVTFLRNYASPSTCMLEDDLRFLHLFSPFAGVSVPFFQPESPFFLASRPTPPPAQTMPG